VIKVVDRWADLHERLVQAAATLDAEVVTVLHDVTDDVEADARNGRRLRAKSTGVKLALSYMAEYAPDDRDERIAATLKLHTELRIYEDCGHRHTDDDVDAGLATEVHEVGIVCEEGFLYSICNECCAAGDRYTGQTECCVADHEHPCWPCNTIKALTGEA
jgi:hypothetical protein